MTLAVNCNKYELVCRDESGDNNATEGIAYQNAIYFEVNFVMLLRSRLPMRLITAPTALTSL